MLYLQRASDEMLAAPDVNGDVFSVCHSKLVHADRNAIRMREQSSAFRGSEMTATCSKNICTPFAKGTVMSTPMSYCTNLGMRPGAILHTAIAEMSVPSADGARCFVILNDESSVYVSGIQKKRGVKAVELRKR